jgi:hypothetical protein
MIVTHHRLASSDVVHLAALPLKLQCLYDPENADRQMAN